MQQIVFAVIEEVERTGGGLVETHKKYWTRSGFLSDNPVFFLALLC